MPMLVSLEQVKTRLRFDHDMEDADLQLLIEGASAAVLNYLNLSHDHYNDSSGDIPADADGPKGIPAEVQNAVLYLIGTLSGDRYGANMKDWQHGYLPPPVIAILYPLRDPAVA